MANDGSLSGDGVTIWFGPSDITGASLSSYATQFQSFITGFDKSGGEQDYESEPVFGGGNVDKEKPRTQIELSFDIILRHTTGVDNFRKIEDGSTIASDGAGPDFNVGAIVIQQSDGTNYYYEAFNNVNSVVFDTEFEAADEWRGTLKFKLSPTNPSGTTNRQFGVANVTSDLTSW